MLVSVVHFGLGQPSALTQRNFGQKTEKHNFPVLGALLGKKSGGPKSFSSKFRNFFTFCVLADLTATGGESQSTGVLGHFGLGRPLALGEIPGGNRETRPAGPQAGPTAKGVPKQNGFPQK